MKRFSAVLALALFALPAHADTYTFDKEHTNILFFINHLGFSDTMGRFTDYDGSLTFNPEKPEASTLNVTFRPAGIVTQSKGLDEHLRKDDFFNVAKFPEARFVSTSVKKTGENTGEITGNLTLLGVTKPVTLNVRFNKQGVHPMTSQTIAGFSAEGTLKRTDFGMKTGIPMVGDEVRLKIETEMVNQDKKPGQGVPKH